jgi:hypothetical protein
VETSDVSVFVCESQGEVGLKLDQSRKAWPLVSNGHTASCITDSFMFRVESECKQCQSGWNQCLIYVHPAAFTFVLLVIISVAGNSLLCRSEVTMSHSRVTKAADRLMSAVHAVFRMCALSTNKRFALFLLVPLKFCPSFSFTLSSFVYLSLLRFLSS